MPAPILAADPYEEMARVAYGRVNTVSSETGLITVELRPANGATGPVLASCRLPEDGTTAPQPGDIVEVLLSQGAKVVSGDANVAQRMLLGSLDGARALTGFRLVYEQVGSGRELEATLLQREGRAGWIVKLEGWQGFAANDPPGTGKGNRPKAGDRSLVQVLRFVRERGNFLLQWSERMRRHVVKAAMDGLAVGNVVHGRVTGIADFGAFVEVRRKQGTFIALLPNAEASWRPNAKASDVVQKGSAHEFQVQKIADTGEGERRITLSLKALLLSPWEQYGEDLSPGDELTGTVRNVTDYGAFVEVLPALEALLHRTHMVPPCKVGEPRERLAPGDRVRCRVLRIDIQARRLSVEEYPRPPGGRSE